MAIALAVTTPALVMAATEIPVRPFRSVTMHNGAHVVLRHGASQQVRLIEGDMECVQVTVDDSDGLVIERIHRRCPGRKDLTIEVVTPEIGALTVTDGGFIRTVGEFPSREKLLGTVENGGSIDMRSLQAKVVLAAVRSGGSIFTAPGQRLLATVSQGGVITYWGSPKVQSDIEHGGMVTRGKAADADKPFEEFGTMAPPPVPPVPPVPQGR